MEDPFFFSSKIERNNERVLTWDPSFLNFGKLCEVFWGIGPWGDLEYELGPGVWIGHLSMNWTLEYELGPGVWIGPWNMNWALAYELGLGVWIGPWSDLENDLGPIVFFFFNLLGSGPKLRLISHVLLIWPWNRNWWQRLRQRPSSKMTETLREIRNVLEERRAYHSHVWRERESRDKDFKVWWCLVLKINQNQMEEERTPLNHRMRWNLLNQQDYLF